MALKVQGIKRKFNLLVYLTECDSNPLYPPFMTQIIKHSDHKKKMVLRTQA